MVQKHAQHWPSAISNLVESGREGQMGWGVYSRDGGEMGSCGQIGQEFKMEGGEKWEVVGKVGGEIKVEVGEKQGVAVGCGI